MTKKPMHKKSNSLLNLLRSITVVVDIGNVYALGYCTRVPKPIYLSQTRVCSRTHVHLEFCEAPT